MKYGNLVFLPDRNIKKADYSGAFLPEAKAYAKFHNIPLKNIHEIDISKPDADRRAQVIKYIELRGQEYDAINSIAFFCHGLKHKIQLGFNVNNIYLLTATMAKYCETEVAVPIYACSAARDMDGQIADDMDPDTVGGDGGFADTLRDSLCKDHMVYCRVMAHVTAGHTTVNPWVRFFDGEGEENGGQGGYWVVEPRSPLWKKWIKWLREDDDNRFRFPFMTYMEILGSVNNV